MEKEREIRQVVEAARRHEEGEKRMEERSRKLETILKELRNENDRCIQST